MFCMYYFLVPFKKAIKFSDLEAEMHIVFVFGVLQAEIPAT